MGRKIRSRDASGEDWTMLVRISNALILLATGELIIAE